MREELARRRISRQRLADDARISLSTLEKALSGRRPFTLATTIRLEDALQVHLRPHGRHADVDMATDLAPPNLGAYARAAVTRLEGPYLVLRPSFDGGAIYAYRTEIHWDEEASHLVFSESDRLDGAFTQVGDVSMPNQSGHVYLVTNTEGQFRLITLSRPAISGEMYGLLTTLRSGVGASLTPAAATIAFLPLRSVPGAVFGRIAPDHPSYADYSAHVRKVTAQRYAEIFTS